MSKINKSNTRKDKLTVRFVESLPFVAKGQKVYTDCELIGFGIIVGKNSKTYFAQRFVNGKTVRVTIGRHGIFTSEQARTDARELLVRMARGENPNQTKREIILEEREIASNEITLAQACDAYQEGKKHLSKVSLYRLRRCREQWFDDWMRLPINQITKEMVLKRHAKIGKKHGGTTANNALKLLRAIYNFALIINSTLPANPVRTLSQAKSWFKQEVRQSVIRPTQLKSWYDAVMLVESSIIRDYLCLLLFTGMRKTEGLSLRWENVDFKEKVITVPDTKNGKPLIIPMSDYVHDLLSSRKKRTSNSKWVFPGTGKTGHLVEPKKAMANIAKKSGVPFMTHDLRRTFITIAESLDISSYALKRLVNHSQGRDVTTGYIVMNVDRLREPMQKVATFIQQKINADNKESR